MATISAESFSKIKQLVQTHYMAFGGMPYGLTVRVNITRRRFGVGCQGMLKLAEFIMSDMVYGIERIAALEKPAPRIPTS